MKFNFGKHKGEDVEDVPDQYLEFIVEKFDEGHIQSECEKELKFRHDSGTIGDNP